MNISIEFDIANASELALKHPYRTLLIFTRKSQTEGRGGEIQWLSTVSIRGQIASVLRFLTRTTPGAHAVREVWEETRRNEIYSFTFYQVGFP